MSNSSLNVKEIIEYAIKEVLVEKGINQIPPINIIFPENMSHGDYTTNIAFTISDQLKKSPLLISEEIVSNLLKKLPLMGKIEAVKPGFINFHFSDDFLVAQIYRMLKDGEKIGKTSKIKNKRIIIEFTDPNPFKEFHVGHLYNNIVGEALARLLESQGAIVHRACYQGDVGLHVAKALWGMQQLMKDMPQNDSPLQERANYMGKAYALGANAYEENEIAKKEIIDINKKVYGKTDVKIMELYNKGRKWSLDYFNKIYQRLGTKFDNFYFESDAGPIGLNYVKQHISDGVFEEHDGAVIFRGDKFGLHTRVFINSLGLPTYEAKELALAITKYDQFPYDQSIIVTANEINEYFKVLLKVLSILNPDLAKKTIHVAHGVVRLPSGKMSSRKGNVLTGEWLLNEAKKRAEEKINEAKHIDIETNIDDNDKIVDQIGVGAVKYALLKSSLGKDIEFDFDKSVSFEGNAGPYLQYTYVRTQSILEKANKKYNIIHDYSPQLDEKNLLRLAMQFENVVEDSASKLSPNTLAQYVYELAKSFNLFYQKFRIIDASISAERDFRLALTDIVGQILSKGLFFLGIAAPKRM